MLSNQADYNQSDQDTEAEYTAVINLSGRHLKRIECLPKGVSPYTLLLSNNEISVVENLQYFGHLQQLSLSGNHIVDIKGISAALTLRVLDLSNNSIIAIEGVSSLRNLEWLNLSGNTIKHIENLDRNYNLYHLDLSDNSIAVISGLKTLMKLKTLLLHGNLISSLEGIKDQVSNTVCTLSLADNEISDLNEVVHLSSLTNLEQLSLVNNPCVLTSSSWRLEVNYRPYLVYCCGNLRNLDGNLVNDQERMLARLLDQAFRRIGHPSPGQHAQLVSILHHLCSDSDPVDQSVQADEVDDLDDNKLLESESFYIPVPSSDVEQTEPDDPIMSEEEAIRLFSLAATIIQAHVRGYLVRKKFDFCQYRRRKYAAASIQALWKGYRARTRDIKVINIRNELRVRRLISLITNLYSALEREHEDAVKSREQLKTAIKYLWHQITEQKRLNQIQLHKEQVKAAIKIQAWWRGCMHKKAFPHKSLNRDKVSILFSLCRKLQMQLDVVTSQINEITKGEKRSKEFRPEDQTVSEGQGQFHDTIRQLDSSQYNISSVPDGEADYTETLSYSSALDQLDAKPGASAAHSLDDAQARTMKTEDLATHENNMPAPSQIGLEEKLVCSNDFVPLDIKEGDTVPSLADQMDHVENETPESNTPKMDLGLTKKISTSLEEGILVTSSLTENNQGPSFAGHTDCYKSDKEHSLDRPIDHDTDDTHDEGAVHRASVVLSPVTQEESQNETEAIVPEAQMDQLEEDTALRTGSPASDVVSLESQLTDGDPSEGDASAEETLHVSIPEIIVSGPIPTDDEGSDAGSAVEGDANDVQKKVDDSAMERQSTDDKQPDVDLTREVPSSCQKSEGHTSYTDTNTDQMKENTSPKQEGGISEKYHENKLLPFRRPTDFSTSQKEASTGVTPSKEAAVTDQSGRTVSSESVHVPNLGERASSLLSQLRSEIASMKTARLNNASPIQEADSAGDGTEMSQQSDMSQSAPQERDSSPLGPVSAVTYRLPLFEDVDSACSSFSLDDFLSDPVNSEEASETDHVHEGAAN